MAINVSQSFHRTSANPVDDTMALTKAEMLTINDNLMPSKYLTICQDDGYIYLYDKANTVDPTTGKFRKFEGGGGGASALSELSDVEIDNPTDGQVLKYNATTQEWENGEGGGGTDENAYHTDDTTFTAIADGDYVPMYDISASGARKSTWSNIKAKLKTYFDTLYNNYALPTATANTLGGVKIGNNMTITDGAISPVIPTYGFTPVGTVISLMGKSAPTNYLSCDGTVYNISTYPELADYFKEQFGSKNYFGGNGTTTFAVPDLRGEFLRGTGTNSHTGNGNGANVGTHQDATLQQSIAYNHTQGVVQLNLKNDLNTDVAGATNYDTRQTRVSWLQIAKTSSGDSVSQVLAEFTARPTNTSVLYCIATKDIYSNPAYDYSTTEKLVGTWIGGEPIYQKTITGTMPTVATDGTAVYASVTIDANIDFCVNLFGVIKNTSSTSKNVRPFPYAETDAKSGVGSVRASLYLNSTGALTIASDLTGLNNREYYITVQYTKTT